MAQLTATTVRLRMRHSRPYLPDNSDGEKPNQPALFSALTLAPALVEEPLMG